MRIGVLTAATKDELDSAKRLGFASFEWMAFANSTAGLGNPKWKEAAEQVKGLAAERGLRISAIGALYANPLDPRQTDHARAVFQRAIDVAELLDVGTVAGFAGAVVETDMNERGGNPIYRSFETFIPQLLEFWEPLAQKACDAGVRLAFEHCPQGQFHLPVMGYNMMAQPAMWERVFSDARAENIGIEWDPSHLVCQLIDPIENIRMFGSRIFHVHAKDAWIDRTLLRRYGICHPGVAEHRFPGLGESDWGQIIHELLRAGYDSDLNIEGWHDPVYRDHESDAPYPLAGRQLEEAGLLIARRTLERYASGIGDA